MTTPSDRGEWRLIAVRRAVKRHDFSRNGIDTDLARLSPVDLDLDAVLSWGHGQLDEPATPHFADLYAVDQYLVRT